MYICTFVPLRFQRFARKLERNSLSVESGPWWLQVVCLAGGLAGGQNSQFSVDKAASKSGSDVYLYGVIGF